MRHKGERIFLSYERVTSDQYRFPIGTAKMHHYSLMPVLSCLMRTDPVVHRVVQ